MGKNIKISEKLYFRYEYLANRYASKIFSYEELSFEFEDLVQEFKIKIFTSIKSYGRRWAKYRRNEATKPVPIKYYLEAACSNKMRDFMKYISRENYKMRIDDIHYDYGVEDDTNISPEKNKFIVKGVDLLEGLTGKERAVFSLFLRGYNTKILNKVYFNNDEKKMRKQVIDSGDEPFTVADIIEMQKSYLIQKYGSDLLQQRKVYSSYSLDEE
jgi:DNA-directed RNA polymerase specialized sigma24 family protein